MQPVDNIYQHHNHAECIADAIATARALCSREGQRWTKNREQVLTCIWQSHRPMGAYDILEQLSGERRLAPPTVYRALDFLLDAGLIHRVNSLNAYVGCSRPGHASGGFLLLCVACKAAQEFHSDAVDAEISARAADYEFVNQDVLLEVSGLCRNCAGAAT